MPSIREKLEQAKTQKKEAKEREAALAQEREVQALKEQYTSLVQRREALVRVKETAQTVHTSVKVSKQNLQSARQNLRELHAESVDEEAQEAMLPKPYEILRSEEFKESEEVTAYAGARDAFRLSAEEARKVKKELEELVPDYESLLPGQLEVLLTDTEKEVTEEIQKMLLEHPEVDPEAAIELRESVLEEKTKKLDFSNRDMYETLGRQLSSKTSLYDAIGKAAPFEQQTRISHLDTLTRLYPDPAALTELDREAMARGVIKKALCDLWVWKPELLIPALREEFKDTGLAIPDELHLERSADGSIGTVLDRGPIIAKLADNQSVRKTVESLIKDYEKFAEYKRLPNEMEALDREIRQLEEDTYDSPRRTVVNKLRGAEADKETSDRKLKPIESWIEALSRIPSIASELRKSLPREVLASSAEGITLSPALYQEQAAELDTRIAEENANLHSLNQQQREIASERDGLFGGRKQSKQERISTTREAIAKAQENITQFGREKEAAWKSHRGYREKLLEALRPYDVELREEFKGGTVEDLLVALEQLPEKEMQKAMRTKTEMLTEAEAAGAALTQAKQESEQFRERVASLKNERIEKERRRTSLEAELRGARLL